MPHGITLDSEGNIWVTDVGAHQVYIFSSFSMEMKTIAYSDWLMKHKRVVGRENQL